MKASPVPVACLKHLLHINPLRNHRIKTGKQGKHAHVCRFACWELRPQSPGSQSKTLWLVLHKKTENAQFSVNLFSSFIRFSGSAHIACDVFKGFGVLPQQAHKGKMSDICPACNFSTVNIPLRVLPQIRKTRKRESPSNCKQFISLIATFSIIHSASKLLNFCYAAN